MNDELEANIVLPDDHPFSMLKKSFLIEPSIRSETETALKAVLERLNPSERGTRFLTGGAYEWVLAVACWVAGLKTIPGGHSQNGVDLLMYRESLKELWSVKSFTTAKLSGEIRIINKMSGGQVSFDHPTIFVSPALPGIVYFDPALAPNFAARTKQDDEKLTIDGRLITKFAKLNPDCVLPFSAPINPGSGRASPQLEIVNNILTSGTYPNLGPVMTQMNKISTTVTFLKAQFESGKIDEKTFQNLLSNLEEDQV
jgi:hypothetical protein